MRSGPFNRSIAMQKEYDQAPKSGVCDFCHFAAGQDQVVTETELFWVVKNKYPYDIWDSLDVIDHLCLVPKRHIDAISAFSANELSAFGELLKEYEGNGYSVYARAASNISKSIPHQHTHLIRMGTNKVNFLLHVRKPHIRLISQ